MCLHKRSKRNKVRAGELHTSELEVSKMNRGAAEQSASGSLALRTWEKAEILAPPAAAAGPFDVFHYPAQAHMEDVIYTLFCP